MKKLIILALVLLMGTAGFGDVLYEEHFDYASEAALTLESAEKIAKILKLELKYRK